MLQTAKTEPTEMSISPVRMTSVAPNAAMSTGTLPRNRSARLPREKNPGATSARMPASSAIASATDASRLRMAERQLQDPILGRLAAAEHAAQRPGVHHGHAVAHAEDLRHL